MFESLLLFSARPGLSGGPSLPSKPYQIFLSVTICFIKPQKESHITIINKVRHSKVANRDVSDFIQNENVVTIGYFIDVIRN